MAARAYVQREQTEDGDDAGASAARERRGRQEELEREAPRVTDKTPSKGKMDGIKARLNAFKTSMEKHAWFRVLESTAEGFSKDKVTENAAAMTYYGVFSLFPLLLLFMSLAALALQSSEDAQEQVMGVITGLLPQGQDQLSEVIAGVIDAKGVAAGVGILALVWGALGWFQIIDSNINEIWGVSKPRSFIKGKLFALAMVGGIGLVVLASFVATAAVHVVQGLTGDIPGTVWLWQAVVSLLSLLTMAGVFFVLYRFAPQRKIAVGDVLPAALATALIFEITRRLLSFYLEKTDMVSGYGPIGAAMALLFWIYVSSIIILVGAELSYAIAKERRHIGADEEMEVVAPAGEQPTAKFAPQVGGGHYAGQDEDEPIKKEGSPSGAPELQPVGTPGTQAPRVVDGIAAASPVPAWRLDEKRRQREAEVRREVKERAEVAGVQVVSDSADGPTKVEPRPLYMDGPLMAFAGVCLGFFIGWFQRGSDEKG
jgi:membrane protein